MRAWFFFAAGILCAAGWPAERASAQTIDAAPQSAGPVLPMGGRQFTATAICGGARKAGFGWIYLHGIDPEAPSQQEIDTAARLDGLGKKLRASVAVLRSGWHCENQDFRAKVCWPRATGEDGRVALEAIFAAAKPCFEDGAPFGIIGFSNGAYFVNALVRRCQKTGAAWLLSVAAGEETQLPPGEPAIKFDEGCASLHLMSGQDDAAEFEPTQRLAQAFKTAGRKIDFESFPGAHELAPAPLEKFLAANTPKAPAAELAFDRQDRCDASGSNLNKTPASTASPDACRGLCFKTKGCEAYTYISGWGRCFLKKTRGKKLPVRFFSGERTEVGNGLETGFDRDYTGKDFRHEKGALSEEACAAACEKEPRCQAFALIERTQNDAGHGQGDCYLKGNRGRVATKLFSCGQRVAD